MKTLVGTTALVTGASGGIGTAIAHALAAAGATVAVAGRRTDALAALVAELRADGHGAHAVPADLADPDGAFVLAQQIQRDVGAIDILVNNAAVEHTAAYTNLDTDTLRGIVETNLTAPMLLTQRLLPGMLDRDRGHVVFISSGVGKIGAAYQGPYSASKAALVGLTQALRAEYQDTRVGFSAVCPGFVVGAGMYQRMIDETGRRANRIMGTTTPARVADRTISAIRHNKPEVHVTGIPVRPLYAATQIDSRLAQRITSQAGMTRFFSQLADHRPGCT